MIPSSDGQTNNGQLERLIACSRFPLICLVVLTHSIGFSFDRVDFLDFSADNIYSFVTQMLSHNFGKIAVCLFFFYSGYLFFRGTASFSWEWCLKKWKNRVHTLLVPFVLWNLLAVFAIVFKNCIFGLWGQYNPEEMGIFAWSSILDWFRIPADFPLWYMEDLMFMVLISPILHFLISKLRLASLLLLVIVYLSGLNPGTVSIRAIFFYTLGAYCSIRNIDVYWICQKLRKPCYFLTVITLLLSTFMNGRTYHELFLRLFYPFGMISFLNVLDAVIRRRADAENKLQKLSATTFFIYGMHEIYILGWTKGAFLRLFGESTPALYIRYFLVPAAVVAVCFYLYKLFDRVMPRTLAYFCGGRK